MSTPTHDGQWWWRKRESDRWQVVVVDRGDVLYQGTECYDSVPVASERGEWGPEARQDDAMQRYQTEQLWCLAALQTLTTDQVEKLTRRVLEFRKDPPEALPPDKAAVAVPDFTRDGQYVALAPVLAREQAVADAMAAIQQYCSDSEATKARLEQARREAASLLADLEARGSTMPEYDRMAEWLRKWEAAP